MRTQGLRPGERLTTGGEFQRCYRLGRRLRTPLFTVCAYRRGEGVAQLGLAVGKRIGTAVVRNRVKRRVRAIFRVRKGSVPAGYDLVVRAAPASARAGYWDLDAAFCKAMAELGCAEMPVHRQV